MCKVSVIVPIYGVKNYIKRCVDSLVNQTTANWEIILVDDGSLDQSGMIADEYAEKYEKVSVYHKKNGGLSDARNYGVSKANGEYVLFVDGDDYVERELLEKVVPLADRLQADLLCFPFQSEEEKTGRIDPYEIRLPKERLINVENYPEILFQSPSACNKLFRRDFWIQSGISFPVGRYYEDLATIPKLYALTNRIAACDTKPLYHYIQREGSIMRNEQFDKNYSDRTLALTELCAFYKKKHLYKKCYKALEFLTFDTGYFQPSKEIVLSNYKDIHLKKFKKYISEMYPNYRKNPYIKGMAKKDKLLYLLLRMHCYRTMIILSEVRKAKDGRKS